MIYLLRHGQTAFNAAGRYQGRIESALTARGQTQAGAMAQALKDRVDAADCIVLTSPLGRAQETAAIVAAGIGGAPVEIEPQLIEIGMGRWEGMTAQQIDEGWPGVRDGLKRNEWFFHAPGGEDHAAATTRLGAALNTAVARPEAVKILVSHAISGRVLRGLYAGLDPYAAMRLEIPQEALFALPGDGRIDRIACPE